MSAQPVCIGCGDVVTQDDVAECRDCDGPVLACEDCVLSGVCLSCKPCFDEQSAVQTQ